MSINSMPRRGASHLPIASTKDVTPVTKKLRFIKPTLPPWTSVDLLYRNAYRSALITNGELVARFEAEVAERVGVKHCVAVSSCTSGLMLGMKAMDLKGEVILPSFTFFATGLAALWSGLKPVFADCLPDTWNLDPADVRRRVTSKTAAIIGVHLYGNPCDVERLASVAVSARCKLIFDSAHAFGSAHRGAAVGSFGDFEVFSLSPTKLLVAGEGGLITTNDSTLDRRLRAARNYGALVHYDPEMQGLNARMSEFNAALGIAGLKLMESKLERHNLIAARYDGLLREERGLQFQVIREGDLSTYKDYSVVVDPLKASLDRDALAAHLLQDGYETKKYFYPPLHQQQIFKEFHSGRDLPLPVTERISSGVLSLPIYYSLSRTIVRDICQCIRRGLRTADRKEISQ